MIYLENRFITTYKFHITISKMETRSKGAVQLEYVRLKEDMMKLMNDKDRSDRAYRDLVAEHKAMKSDYNQLKTKHSETKAKFDDCTKQLTAINMEVTKLASKCEVRSDDLEHSICWGFHV